MNSKIISNDSDRMTTMRQASLFSLLLACATFIFVLPAIPVSIRWLSFLLLSVIIFLAASSISSRLILVGMITIFIEGITGLFDFIYLHYLAEITTNLFIVYIVASVVRQIMKREQVSIYTLLEALIGYLLLGIMFVSLVSFCNLHIPGSFSSATTSELGLTYFTFVTLTTTGYGDVVPTSSVSKSLAMLIAVAGQFYVAVIVAILVGKYSNKKVAT